MAFDITACNGDRSELIEAPPLTQPSIPLLVPIIFASAQLFPPVLRRYKGSPDKATVPALFPTARSDEPSDQQRPKIRRDDEQVYKVAKCSSGALSSHYSAC